EAGTKIAASPSALDRSPIHAVSAPRVARDRFTFLQDEVPLTIFSPNSAVRAAANRFRYRIRRCARPVRLATLRPTTPISTDFGYDRGTPIDRFYIERFLSEQRHFIRGRVLEVSDAGYTDRFGSTVTQRDILDVDPR